MKTSHLLILVFAALGGCMSNPGIVQMSSDTFMLSRTGSAGAFTNMGKLKAEIINEANAFAQSKGKMAVPIAASEIPFAPGRHPSYEYQFRLVDPDSAAARGGALLPRADVVIENNHNGSGPAKAPDLYSELVKLEDLKKRGLLTDAEFEAQKRKVLNGR